MSDNEHDDDADALARNVLQWADVPVSSVGVTYGYGTAMHTRTMMATMSQAWVPSTMTTDRTVTIDQPTPRTDWVVERVPFDGYVTGERCPECGGHAVYDPVRGVLECTEAMHQTWDAPAAPRPRPRRRQRSPKPSEPQVPALPTVPPIGRRKITL